MRWNPAFLVRLGRRPAVLSVLPTVTSPIFGLDTAQAGTFYSDTAGTLAPTNLGPVARVNDAFGGGAGLRFEQANSSLRPTWVTNIAAGRPALRFSPSQHLLGAGATNPGASYQGKSFTVAMAIRRPVNGTRGTVFSAGNLTGGTNGAWLDLLSFVFRENGEPFMERNTGSTYGSLLLGSATYPAGQLLRVVARGSDLNGMDLVARGTLGTFTGAAAMKTEADLFTWNGAAFGGAMGAQDAAFPREPFNGDIFEFRFWGARADDATRDALLTYLDGKWGA